MQWKPAVNAFMTTFADRWSDAPNLLRETAETPSAR